MDQTPGSEQEPFTAPIKRQSILLQRICEHIWLANDGFPYKRRDSPDKETEVLVVIYMALRRAKRRGSMRDKQDAKQLCFLFLAVSCDWPLIGLLNFSAFVIPDFAKCNLYFLASPASHQASQSGSPVDDPTSR